VVLKNTKNINSQQLIMDYKFLKFKNFYLSTKQGFSLVELLTVMAIMIIMAAVLLVNRNESKPAYDVETGARQVAAQLRALQNEALSGKSFDTNADGIADTIACEMRFNTKANNSMEYAYKISYYDCTVPIKQLIPGSSQDFNIGKKFVNYRDVMLSENVDYYVKFTPPQATVSTDLPFFGAEPGILIKSRDGTKTNLVCVYKNGRILETKNAVCP